MDKAIRQKVSLKSLKLQPSIHSSKFSTLKQKYQDSPSKPSNSKLSQAQSSRNLSTTKSSLEPIIQESVRIKKQIKKPKRNMSLENIFKEPENDLGLRRHSTIIETTSSEKPWDSSEVPYSPSDALQYFKSHLTPYEQKEILGFSDIYYLAYGVLKLDINPKKENNGLDDERNDLILVKHDHIVYRYEIFEIIGRGSYGQVIKAYDHKDKKIVAIKIIRNLNCIQQQARIEIQVLYKIIQQNDLNDYVVRILDCHVFRNHIIETFDILDTNLYHYLKSKNFQPLPLASVKTYSSQILEGMKFYESLKIIHCDLKPENIMLNSDHSKSIIIDFGSSCFTSKKLFTYIQSRYYRAPEVILEIGYDFKIDIWSFGCVVAELAIGRPLFAGKNELDQFLAITEVLGPPPAAMMEQSTKCDQIIQQLKTKSGSKRIPSSRTLKSLLPECDPLFLDFLASCLAWNPADRPMPSEALSHQWFKSNMARQGSLPDIRLDRLTLKSLKRKKSTEGGLTRRSCKSRTLIQKAKNE